MSLIEEMVNSNTERYRKIIADAIRNQLETSALLQRKGKETAMQATYNGFTGELYKLERRSRFSEESFYDLEIFDVEKKCNMQFFGVKLEDVKFSGGVMTFGG